MGTSEGWVPHGCKVDGFMNTVMPQYNSQPPTQNTLACNRIAHYQRPEPATQPPTTTKATDPTNGGPERSRQPCATYSPSPRSRPWLCSSPQGPTPTPTRTCRTRSPGCSAVAGCLLNELKAQGQAEFGVDVTSSTDPIQNYCPDKAPISHENSAFRLHHHHGWYGHRHSHHTGTAAANAEPRCMNYMWYRACHDPATDKWQLCNLYNAPAPLAPSPGIPGS